MDWSKAKTVLITLFLCLNLFLLYNIYLLGSDDKNPSKIKEDILKILDERNIKIKCDIPDYDKKTGQLKFESSRQDIDTLISNIENAKYDISKSDILKDGYFNITFKTDKNIENQEQIEDILIMLNKGLDRIYELEKAISIDEKFTLSYVRQYKEGKLFGDFIEINAKNNEINIKGQYKKIDGAIEHKEIVSAYYILLSIKHESVINDIEFGYYPLSENEFYDNPVWKLVYEDNTSEFYDAYNGKKIEV